MTASTTDTSRQGHGRAVLDELSPLHRELHTAAFAPGDLDTKTKELIALAIGVTFLMNGGPATIYGPRA